MEGEATEETRAPEAPPQDAVDPGMPRIIATFADGKSTLTRIDIDDRLSPMQVAELAAVLHAHANVQLEAMAMQAISSSAKSRLVLAKPGHLPRA